MLEKLDLYIQSTGKKYKDCLATIRNWARNEKGKGKIGNKGEIPEPKTYCVFDSDYPFYYRKWATDEKLSKYNKMADVLKNDIEAIKKNINIQNTITTYLNL